MKTEAFIGYTAWAAGGFSPLDYNLTLTPMGSAGNFTDQELTRRCVIGTRVGGANQAPSNVTKTTSSSQSPQPQPAQPGPQVVLATGARNMFKDGSIGSLVALAALVIIVGRIS
jgi:hypothetical protein